MKKVFIEISSKDLDEIGNLPGFMPIYMYPKLSEVHVRCWGFMIIDKTEYFFRIDLSEEKLLKITQQCLEFKLRLVGLFSLICQGCADINEMKDLLKKCIEALEFLDKMYGK